MSWNHHFIRAAALLLTLGLSGCVTTPGYRYVVDVGGDYYYDERPAVASSVHILPAYGAFGYGHPGGWYGSVGFGFGTYYGLGGYYGPLWGGFSPYYGYTGYWRPPYYYTPRYARPHHYYRPPYYRPPYYRHARPMPWHDAGHAWQHPGDDRHGSSRGQSDWNRPPRRGPGHRPWRGHDNAGVDGPRGRPGERGRPAPRIRVGAPPPVREARDVSIQPAPGAPMQRVRHAITAPTRETSLPPSRQTVRVGNRGGARVAAVDGRPAQRGMAPLPARRGAAPTVQPRATGPTAPAPRRAMVQPAPAARARPMPQARPAPMPSSAPRPAPVMRSAPPPAARHSGPSRRGGGPQRQH